MRVARKLLYLSKHRTSAADRGFRRSKNIFLRDMLRDLSAHPDTLEGIHPWKKGGFAEHPLMKMTEAPIAINLIDQGARRTTAPTILGTVGQHQGIVA